jgi:hypothetical protein
LDLRNPLAQVNLLIHLCMPYPHGDRIEPLLRQMGFSVYVVDRRISLPRSTSRTLWEARYCRSV